LTGPKRRVLRKIFVSRAHVKLGKFCVAACGKKAITEQTGGGHDGFRKMERGKGIIIGIARGKREIQNRSDFVFLEHCLQGVGTKVGKWRG